MNIIKGKELVEKVIDNNFKSDSGGGMEMLNTNRILGWYKRKQHTRSDMMFHPFIQKLCMKTEAMQSNTWLLKKGEEKKNKQTNSKQQTSHQTTLKADLKCGHIDCGLLSFCSPCPLSLLTLLKGKEHSHKLRILCHIHVLQQPNKSQCSFTVTLLPRYLCDCNCLAPEVPQTTAMIQLEGKYINTTNNRQLYNSYLDFVLKTNFLYFNH